MYGQGNSERLLMQHMQQNPLFKRYMQITSLLWSDTDRYSEGSAIAEGGMVDLTIKANSRPAYGSTPNCLIYGPQNVTSTCLLTKLSDLTNLSVDLKQTIVGIMKQKSPGSRLYQIPKSIEGGELKQLVEGKTVRAIKEDAPAVSSKIMVLVDSDISSEKDPDFYLNFYSYRNSLLVIQIADKPARMVFLKRGDTKIGFPGAHREHTIVARTSRSAEGKVNTRLEQLTVSDKKKTGIVCVTIPLTGNRCIPVEEITLLSSSFDRYNEEHKAIKAEMESIQASIDSIETKHFSEVSIDIVRELYRAAERGTGRSDFERKEGKKNTYFDEFQTHIENTVSEVLENAQQKRDAIENLSAQIRAVETLNIALERNHWAIFKGLPSEEEGLRVFSRKLDLIKNNLKTYENLNERMYQEFYDRSLDDVFPRHRSSRWDDEDKGVYRSAGGSYRGVPMGSDSDSDSDSRRTRASNRGGDTTRGGTRGLDSDEEEATSVAYSDLQPGVAFSDLVPDADLRKAPLTDMNINYSLPIRVDEITVLKVEYNQGTNAAQRVLQEYNKGIDDDKLDTLAQNSAKVRASFKANKYACPE